MADRNDEQKGRAALAVIREAPRVPVSPAASRSSVPFIGFTANGLARHEKGLAVAEEARLRRLQASDDIAYHQATTEERWAVRYTNDQNNAVLESLRTQNDIARAQSESEAIKANRDQDKLSTQTRTLQLEKELANEQADGEDDENETAQEYYETRLDILKDAIATLNLEKDELLKDEANWRDVQSINEQITEYTQIHRQLHSEFTKLMLGIA